MRAVDAAGDFVAAEPSYAALAIYRLFADPAPACMHAHYAAWWCYAARIDHA